MRTKKTTPTRGQGGTNTTAGMWLARFFFYFIFFHIKSNKQQSFYFNKMLLLFLTLQSNHLSEPDKHK